MDSMTQLVDHLQDNREDGTCWRTYLSESPDGSYWIILRKPCPLNKSTEFGLTWYADSQIRKRRRCIKAEEGHPNDCDELFQDPFYF